MKKIAIILARQGSKGIPKKNLALAGGISLLARTITAAKESGIFDLIVTSTDGEDIAQEAQRFGSAVVMRPAELASDQATSISGVLHVLDNLRLEQGLACLLQPTSPLRTAQHIKEAYALFTKQNQGSVIAATECEHHPYKYLVEKNHVYVPAHELRDLESPRQRLPKAYRPNGAIYFNLIEDLMRTRRFFVDPINLYIMNAQDSIDVDKPEDLVRVNQLLSKESIR